MSSNCQVSTTREKVPKFAILPSLPEVPFQGVSLPKEEKGVQSVGHSGYSSVEKKPSHRRSKSDNAIPKNPHSAFISILNNVVRKWNEEGSSKNLQIESKESLHPIASLVQKLIINGWLENCEDEITVADINNLWSGFFKDSISDNEKKISLNKGEIETNREKIKLAEKKVESLLNSLDLLKHDSLSKIEKMEDEMMSDYITFHLKFESLQRSLRLIGEQLENFNIAFQFLSENHSKVIGSLKELERQQKETKDSLDKLEIKHGAEISKNRMSSGTLKSTNNLKNDWVITHLNSYQKNSSNRFQEINQEINNIKSLNERIIIFGVFACFFSAIAILISILNFFSRRFCKKDDGSLNVKITR